MNRDFFMIICAKIQPISRAYMIKTFTAFLLKIERYVPDIRVRFNI